MRRLLVFAWVALAAGCSGSSSSSDVNAGGGGGGGGGAGGGGGPSGGGGGDVVDAGGGDDAQDGAANGLDGGTGDDGSTRTGCPGGFTYTAATDRNPHPATPPTLGPAGTVVKDPVYGTPLLRLTDATTLTATTSFRVANEFWGNDWSTDAALFYLQDSNGAFLPYSFDTTKIAAARAQDSTGAALKMPLAPGGFSRTQATVFYGLKGLTVAQYDFATGTTTDIVDLTTIVPGATGNVLGVQQGKNGLLTASFGGPEQDAMPYVAIYDPATSTHHVVDVTTSTLDGNPVGATIGGGVHTFKIDASGQYVTFSVAGGATGNWLWDTNAGTVISLPSLGAVGWGAWEHKGNADSYDWELSTFAAPTASPAALVSPALTPTDSLASSSAGWDNAAMGPGMPLIVETMRQPSDTGPLRAWDDEIVAVRTDGVASTVWRFAHNFNTYTGTIYSDAFYYLFIPRVSQNGLFVLFDSNWNGTLGTDATGNPRTDAFIAVLTGSCGP